MAKNAKKNKIYSNLYVKRRLMKLEIDVFGIIANGLLHHTPKVKVLNQIKKEIQRISVLLGLSDLEKNRIWLNCYAHYLTVVKKTTVSLLRIERKFGKKEDYEESLQQRRQMIYSSIRANIQNNYLIKEANELMYMYEYRVKHDEMFGPGGILDAARSNSRAYSPFFLCSSHPKTAKDHAGWEGKMYYDEDWEQYADEADHDRIRAYIQNRKLRSVQWVVGAPVYLVTRRNCKHFLTNIPIEEVMHGSARSILKRRNLFMKEEVPVSKEIRAYREYYNRLKVEIALHNLVPNEQLAKDIKKDKKLLDKWRKTL